MNKNTKTHSLEIALPPKVSAPADTSERSEELATERAQEREKEKNLVETEHHKVQGFRMGQRVRSLKNQLGVSQSFFLRRVAGYCVRCFRMLTVGCKHGQGHMLSTLMGVLLDILAGEGHTWKGRMQEDVEVFAVFCILVGVILC